MQFKKYSTISGHEIDRNHESQLRKLLRNLKSILLLSIWHLINYTEKKIHVLQYMQYIYIIFSLMRGNCLNFLLWVMIFVVVA